MISGLAWECSCGNIEYSEETPEECSKCGSINGFMQIPADVLKSREEMGIDDEEPDLKVTKTILKTSKTAKATKRRKKI